MTDSENILVKLHMHR